MKPFLIVAALSILTACAHEPAPKETQALPSRRVQIAPAQTLLRSSGEEVVGTVRARTFAEISASVMGTVRELSVSVGTQVRSGQVLARLSAKEIEAKVEQARALLAQAQLELRRAQELQTRGAVAPADYDALLARHRVAAASLAEAQVMLGYTVIRAPFAGVVTAKYAELGGLALPGKPLLLIEDPNSLRLEAAVPEAVSSGLRVGARMTLRIDTLDRELTATVSELSPTADPVSRTVLVKLDLPQGEAQLRPGMFGRLLVQVPDGKSLRIPASALVQRGQLETVFVAVGGHAQLRLVRSARSHGDAVELLSGLEDGELVVISDPSLLRDGQPIVSMTP